MLVGEKESKGDHKHEPTHLYVGVKLPKELGFRELTKKETDDLI